MPTTPLATWAPRSATQAAVELRPPADFPSEDWRGRDWAHFFWPAVLCKSRRAMCPYCLFLDPTHRIALGAARPGRHVGKSGLQTQGKLLHAGPLGSIMARKDQCQTMGLGREIIV